MRRHEIGMACKLHDVVLAHAVAKPTRYRRIPQIVESSNPDICSVQNLLEARLKIIDDLEARIRAKFQFFCKIETVYRRYYIEAKNS